MRALVSILLAAAAVVPVRATPPALPVADEVSAEFAAAFRDAVRGAIAIAFVTCESPAAKARIAAAAERFSAVRPSVVARLGELEAGREAGALLVEPANLYPPGCPPPEELERRITAFEAAVARLEAAAAR